MRNLLSRRNLLHLARTVGPDGVLAFDFDGTLAPIVAVPGAAGMRDETRHLLVAISELRPVVIVSGRSVADVTPRLHGVRTAAIVGNHGVEPSAAMAGAKRTVAGWRPLLDATVGRLAGVHVEDKVYSIAVHYRHASSPRMVREVLAEVRRQLGDAVRVTEGLALVNLVPAGAPTKGDAVRWVEARLSARVVLYAGDEETDEDAFAVLDQTRSVGVRIGKSKRSSARFYLPGQEAVDSMLHHVLSVVQRGAARGSPGRPSRAPLASVSAQARE